MSAYRVQQAHRIMKRHSEKMSNLTYYIDNNLDEYDHYSMDQHKYIHRGSSGKGRSKLEAALNTNRPDPCGHTRKIVQKLSNSHKKHAS